MFYYNTQITINGKKDMIDIFYNDDYLLKVTDRYVQLSTNLGTTHKPFYTSVLWREKYEYNKNQNLIQLSENIFVIVDDKNQDEIMISIADADIDKVTLIKFK